MLAGLSQRLDAVEARAERAVAELRREVESVGSRVALVEREGAAALLLLERAVHDLRERVGATSGGGSVAQVVTQIRAHQARASSEALQMRDSVWGLRRRVAELEAERSTPRTAPVPNRGSSPQEATLCAGPTSGRQTSEDAAAASLDLSLRETAADPAGAMLRGISEQLAGCEHRSADAIKRIGREVIRIAQDLDGRIGEVERRSGAQAVQADGEMARIAAAVEARLSRANDAQADVLAKLSAEIAGVADMLADRIAEAERRNAEGVSQGLGEVNARLEHTSDKLNSRYEVFASDLAELVRQSDEHTARHVAEARGQIEAARQVSAASVNSLDCSLPGGTSPAAAAQVAASRSVAGRTDVVRPRRSTPSANLGSTPATASTAEGSNGLAAPRPDAAARRIQLNGGDPGPAGRREALVAASTSDGAPAETGSACAAAAVEPWPIPLHITPTVDPALRPSSLREVLDSARAAARAQADSRRRPPVPASSSDEPSSPRGGLGLLRLRRRG